MQELTNPKPPVMKRTKDNLSPLLGLLNNPAITGAELPTGTSDDATPMPPDPVFDAVAAHPAMQKIVEAVAGPKKPLLSRVFLTGRTHVGKDNALLAAGFTIAGFADPLYKLAEFFFGRGHLKDATRPFLQRAGQIGRGFISPAHPLNVERAVFISCIRSLAAAHAFDNIPGVAWSAFGSNENIWLDALVNRVKAIDESTRIGVSNVRFANEKARLEDEGFTGFHCMCSPASWAARLKKDGIDPNSPLLKDESEKLAAGLDATVLKIISRDPRGKKLKVIWNDSVPAPSSRLLTVAEFRAEVGL